MANANETGFYQCKRGSFGFAVGKDDASSFVVADLAKDITNSCLKPRGGNCPDDCPVKIYSMIRKKQYLQ